MQELIKTQLAAVSALWLLKHRAGFCGAGRSLWAWRCLPQHPACQYPSKITVESKHGGAGNCLKDPLVSGHIFLLLGRGESNFLILSGNTFT